jgi:hypothetical protein
MKTHLPTLLNTNIHLIHLYIYILNGTFNNNKLNCSKKQFRYKPLISLYYITYLIS